VGILPRFAYVKDTPYGIKNTPPGVESTIARKTQEQERGRWFIEPVFSLSFTAGRRAVG
jgi:hypothetical protein